MCLFVGVMGAGAPPPLQLATDPWPPFTDGPDQPRIAVELVETALRRAGHPAQTTVLAPGRQLPALQKGRFDGSPALWKDAERRAYLRYSKPYLENRLVLVARSGTDVSAKNLAELKDKRVGIVTGYSYGSVLDQAPQTRFVNGDSDEMNLKSLVVGELDYVLADEVLIFHIFDRSPKEASAQLAVGKTAMVRRPLHFAIRKDHPQAQVILDRFDRAIREMIKDGEFNRILEIDWIRADVDGDGRTELVVGGDRVGPEEPQDGYDLIEGDGDDAVEQSRSRRYVIEGKVYEGWESVPERYKKPPQVKEPPRDGVTLFKW